MSNQFWIPLVFWGSTLLSVALSIAGVVRRSPWFLFAGALLAVPAALYLGATPRFRPWAYGLPFLQVGAAVAAGRSRALAGVLILPLIGVTCFLAALVLGQ